MRALQEKMAHIPTTLENADLKASTAVAIGDLEVKMQHCHGCGGFEVRIFLLERGLVQIRATLFAATNPRTCVTPKFVLLVRIDGGTLGWPVPLPVI